MIADEKTIREAALQLSPQKRIDLIRELEMSLDANAIAEDRAAFSAELERRWQEYLANPSIATPAREVIANLRQRLTASDAAR
jgi:putative addiction module component (TIGR02574 family)